MVRRWRFLRRDAKMPPGHPAVSEGRTMRRGALMAVLLALVGCAGPAPPAPARRRAEAVAAVEKLGGRVAEDAAALGRPVVGDLGRCELTDADLRCLESLTDLQVLRLNHTEVTAAGLVHVAGLTELRKL